MTADVITARRRRRPRPPLDVNAGRGFAFVDHVGHVQPSGFLPLTVGSIRDQPLSSIYRESRLLQALRDPDALVGRCGRCEYRHICGGSRSRAYAIHGNPLADDPACAFVPGDGREVIVANVCRDDTTGPTPARM